jgi:hypothetical protein
MDRQTDITIFLDEIIHQMVKINKNLEYIANDIAVQRALQDNVLRKGLNNGNSNLP